MSEAVRYEVLKEHQDKFQKIEESYMEERVKNCQEIIAKSRRIPVKEPLKFDFPQKDVFERPCRGIYESCRYDEILPEDLQYFNLNETDGNFPKRQNCTNSPAQNCTNSPAAVVKSQTWPNPLNRPKPDANTGKSNDDSSSQFVGFRTALEQKELDDLKKNNQQTSQGKSACNTMMNFKKKTLGGRRTVNSSFVSPMAKATENNASSKTSSTDIPQSLAHLDAKMVEQILGESMHNFKPVAWEDIAGLESAKSTFLEAIIMPLRRPDLFTGVRCPPRGVLLFGPPGTGKTLIAKSIASQAKAKFFSINPSSLTSKWVGEAEKLVKTLFAVAAAHQPAIIFIDEVDSLLSKRSGNENESTLRLKNEFLIHLDGAASSDETRILVIGATNRPQELDEAVRRRFVRRLYVPLPTKEARHKIIEKLIKQVKHNLDPPQVEQLADLTDGYSGADVDSLCRYASMAPLRSLTPDQMEVIKPHQLPPVTMADFKEALRVISKSVSAEDCQQFVAWNEIYGVRH
ncbi:hypothetical protein KR018_005231 [Drosophila ironensis]|nr:hypothetical protein KR018_005231 [Drosophila ironensis]